MRDDPRRAEIQPGLSFRLHPSLVGGLPRLGPCRFLGLASGRLLRRLFHRARAAHPPRGANLGFDLARDLAMLLQIVARIVLALADAVLAVGVPRAGLLHDVVQDTVLDNLALA